jgi:hypothetical protein
MPPLKKRHNPKLPPSLILDLKTTPKHPLFSPKDFPFLSPQAPPLFPFKNPNAALIVHTKN